MIVLAVVYFAVPFTDRFEGSVVLIASVGLILVIATVVWQVRSVVTAPMPVLRAIEGFALVLPLVLFAFAAAYLAVSAGTTNAFTESLNHTGAMYFSVTTMTTVGYGDIAPMSDLARVFVMAQMIINVAVLGVAVRVTATAVRRNLGRS